MSTLLNVIWLVFSGIWLALLYALAGLIVCITIIGIPLGVAAFRMTSMVVWPFGRTAVRRADAGAGSAIANVLWFVLCGWWLIIGNLKLIPITLTPYGREIVPTSDAPLR